MGQATIAVKRVLNAGSGPYDPDRLHPAFRNSSYWTEVRYDIDKLVKPDIVGSIVDLGAIGDATFDAIWCSHNLEHLHTHDVPKALAEFRRVLKPDGFALICTPDLEAIAELVVNGRLDDVAYQSPAGPDHRTRHALRAFVSISRGNLFMSHQHRLHHRSTGAAAGRQRFLRGAGEKRIVLRSLGASPLMPEANKEDLLLHLRANELDLFPDEPDRSQASCANRDAAAVSLPRRAACSYQCRASASFCSTPRPARYMSPSAIWASGIPCSAAFWNQARP